MQKKLTITVDADVYDGLHAVVGRRRISRFLSDFARPHVVGTDLRAGYAGLVAHVADEPCRLVRHDIDAVARTVRVQRDL